MRVLVTGITGFAGVHLAELLLAPGDNTVLGLSRRGQWPAPWGHLAGRVDLRICDMCDPSSVESLLRELQPQQVYHLAGYAHVGQSLREPDAAWAGNLTTTRSLYTALERWGGKPRIVYIGSGQIYGESEHPDEAHNENCPLRPASPYATSKAAADLLSYQCTRVPGLDIVRARPFNHVGPGQSPQFAVSSFARQVVRIERGEQPPLLETGNLDSQRDFTDVRDMVRAYVALMERGRTGEAYNIGTGTLSRMQDVLDRLLALASVKVEVRQRKELVRATDPAAVRADAAKLRRETGWAPAHTLDQTLADMLAYWRNQG